MRSWLDITGKWKLRKCDSMKVCTVESVFYLVAHLTMHLHSPAIRMRKFLTTPFPFPLVQMARTFLFFYVYTVPFALLSDPSNSYAHCVVIFILTYGFMGLEYVSIELDNPFGEDANDFDNLGMAYTAFEDTYLSILHLDGPEWTDRLRKRMDPRGKNAGRGINEHAPLIV